MKKIVSLLVAIILFVQCGAGAASTLTLPSALKTIEAEAFRGDTSLDEVVLPDGTQRIGELAFADSSVRMISIPDSVENIADNAFDNCNHLIVVANNNTAADEYCYRKGFTRWTYAQIENAKDYTFRYDNTEGYLVSGYTGQNTKLSFPVCTLDGYPVSGIAANSFGGNTSIEELVIPGYQSWNAFPRNVFDHCSSLRRVTIEEGATTILSLAFDGCINLEYVKLPSTINHMQEQLFRGCTKLKSIIYPRDMFIPQGNKMFSQGWGYTHSCALAGSSVETVYIPEGATTIMKDAFFDAASVRHIYIPESVTSFDPPSGNADVTHSPFSRIEGSITLHVTAGSAAEQYAVSRSIKYEKNFSLEDVTTYAGDTATFDIHAISQLYEIDSIQWQYSTDSGEHWGPVDFCDGESFDQQTSMSFTAEKEMDGWLFKACVTSGSIRKEDTAVLTVLDPLEITAQPQSAAVDIGDTVSFTVSATGSHLQYDWKYSEDEQNWISLNAKNPTFSYTVTEQNKDYYYRCDITDGISTLSTNAVRADIMPYRLPSDITLTRNGVLTFNITETKPHTIMLGVYGAKAPASSFSLFSTAYADGPELLAVIPINITAGQTSESVNIGNFFTATGDYHAAVKAVGSADEENARDMGVGRAAVSNTVYFTRPSESLSTPVNICWGTGYAYARAMWDAVENAASYQVILYSGEDIVASRNINTNYFDFSSGWVDFSHVDTNRYTFTVTALSQDITQVSHSSESAHSALLAEPDQTNAVTIVTHPASKYVSKDSAASVSIAAAGVGITYQWYVNGEPVGQEDDASVNLNTSAIGEQAAYCVVTDAFGNTLTSSTATITVLDDSPIAHIITGHPQDVTVDPDGHSVHFTVAHNLPGYYRIEYTWYCSDDGGNAWAECGNYRSSMSYGAYPKNNGLMFRCAVKATSPTGVVICEDMSDAATLTVRKENIAITTNLDSNYWTAGEDYAYIGASADDSLEAQLTYQWYVNGQAWPGATMNQFDLSLITVDSSLFCRLSAGEATRDSRTAIVHVGENPATGIEIVNQSSNNPDHLAVGDSLKLKANLSPAKCTSTASWESSRPSVATVTEYGTVEAVGFGDAVITAQADGVTRTIRVHVDSYKVTYDPAGGRFPDGSTTTLTERIVSGQNATLPALYLQGDTFRGWMLNDEIVTSLTPTSNVVLYASWLTSTQQEDDDVVIVQDLALTQYAKIDDYALFEVVTNGAKIRSYEWQVSTDGGASWTKYDDGIADGRKTSLEVQASGENNGWQFRVVITGYRNGTVVTSAVSTLVTGTTDTPEQTESFSFTLQPVSLTRNEGETAIFTVAVNTDHASYQWQKDGVNITGATGATITISASELGDAGSYACAVTAGQCTKTSESATLTVNQTQIHITTQPAGKTITKGATETLTVAATPDGVTYAWEEKDGNNWLPMGTGPSLNLGGLTAGSHIIHAVVSKDGFNPVVSSEVTVVVVQRTYTVTYDANGGLFGLVSSYEVETVDGAYRISDEQPTREGYEFAGWTIDNALIDGDTIQVYGDVTLVASWIEKKYRVTYNAAPGTFDGITVFMDDGIKGEYTLISREPTRDGYTFNGWKLNGQTVSGTILVSENITLKADWLENPAPAITTDLRANYYPGSGGQGFSIAAEGTDLHYQWQTKAPGGEWTNVQGNDSDTYAPALIRADDGLQVRCIITDRGYTPATSTTSAVATFHWVIHATSVRIEEVDVPADLIIGDQPVLRAVVEPDDCTDAVAWSSDDVDVATVADGTVTINGLGNTVIRASANGVSASYSMTVNHVTVILDANGGSFAGNENTVTRRVAIGIYTPADIPENGVHVLSGWSTAANGEAAESIEISSDTTLYAIWEMHAVTLTIQAPEDLSELAVGDVITLTARCEPENAVDQFTWTSDVPETATVEEGTVTIQGTGTVVITAIAGEATDSITLTINRVYVTLDANGGAFSDHESEEPLLQKRVKTETGAYTPDDQPEKVGFVFQGWSDTATGQVITNISISEPTTLYAIWEEDEPTGELVIRTHPAHTLAEEGDSAVFTVDVGLQNGERFWIPEGITYQWQVYNQVNWWAAGSWEDISGAGEDSYTVDPVTGTTMRKKYRVVVTYGQDSETSDEAILFVLCGSDYPETLSVNEGEVVDLSIGVYGSYPYPEIKIFEVSDNQQGELSDPVFRAKQEQNGHQYFGQIKQDDAIVHTKTMTLTVQEPDLRPGSVEIEAQNDNIMIPFDPTMTESVTIYSRVCDQNQDEYTGEAYDHLYYVWEESTDGISWTITDLYGVEDSAGDFHPATFERQIDSGSEAGTYYFRLSVNGVVSEPVEITIVRDEISDVCPECGGTGGMHNPGCSYYSGEGQDPYDPDNQMP